MWYVVLQRLLRQCNKSKVILGYLLFTLAPGSAIVEKPKTTCGNDLNKLLFEEFRSFVMLKVGKLIICSILISVFASCVPLKLAGGLEIPLAQSIFLHAFWFFSNFDIDGVPKGLPAVVPFKENSRGRLDVLTTIDGGREVVFFFDTGAPDTALSNRSLLHPIKVVGTRLLKRKYANLSDVFEEECGLTPRISFGKLSFLYPWVAYFDSSRMVSGDEFCGFLGSSYLSNCEVTIDRERSSIFIRRACREKTKCWDSFDARPYTFPFSGPQIVLTGKVEEIPVNFVFDTGATGIVIPPKIANSLGLAIVPGNLSAKGVTTLYPENQSYTYKIRELVVGSTKFFNLDSTAILTNNLSQGRSGRSSVSLGGKSLMKQLKSVCIDYQNRKINFVPY